MMTSSAETISSMTAMIETLNVNSFETKNSEKSFDKRFLKPDFNCFVVIINAFKKSNEKTYKRNKLLNLITDYVFCDHTLKTLLLNTSQLPSNELRIIGSNLETILVSIPEMVSNHMKSNVCHKFERNVYFKRIVETIHSCLEDIHHLIVKQIDSSVQFLSSLFGRIAFIGFSDIVFNELIIKLLIECENDFIYRRIAYKVIVCQQKQEYIEVLIKSIFTLVPNYRTIVWIIGKSVETNPKIKFLITNKFLLITELKNNQIFDNIFGYLSQNSLKLFFESFNNLLNAWSNSSAIKYRSYSQHLYLSRGLMIGSRFMKDIDFSEVEDKFRRLTMNGIELHLKNSQIDFRNIGLTVGQTLMSLFGRQNNKIDFEIQENEEIKHLNELFANNCNQNDIKSETQNNLPKINDKEVTEESVPAVTQKVRNIDLDSDDDEDLIPYDMSDDIPIDVIKRPIYLRDCMEGLLDYEKDEWFAKCLQNAEHIIRTNCESVIEISEEFAQILLRLDDICAINDFIGLRMRALIALCVCSPNLVAPYLCSVFYADNHSIRQRLDVLEVLLSASSELSSNPKLNTNKTNIKKICVSECEETNADIHWTQVVNNRVEAKTRVLAHKTKDPNEKAFVNRFLPFAGHFFFPLIKNISKNDIKFDLLEEDHYVFGRMIYTLGLMVKNASFAPVSKHMGKELLDFLIGFRYHSEVYVREAIIFAFCMVLMSVSPTYLINDMTLQIIELQLWLKDITERESNTQCIQKAFTALQLMKEVVNEMPFSFK